MGLKSWEVSNEFWSRVEPLIPETKRDEGKSYQSCPGAGRKKKSARLVFEAIVYVLRTGCQWKALPKAVFGSSSSIHQYFLDWAKAGFFRKLWLAGLAEYDEMEGIAWRWQSVDGAMMKAPMAKEAVGSKEKKGSKRNLLVEGRGVPLSIVVTGANRHDVSQIEAVLDAIAIVRPNPPKRRSKHLCADAGYRGNNAKEIMIRHGYIPHIKSRKEETKALKSNPKKKARRWIVEVAHSWFNRFRKLLVRYEKLESSCLALHHLAASIIAFRKIKSEINIIYG